MTGAPTAFESPATPGADTVLPMINGRCVFFDDRGRRCRVHQTLGHDALPLACRQFPRVVVRDPRGVSVTLSHYCPTAASLLDSDGPIAVTDDAPAFPAGAEYDGLDARDSLPPLLRPGMLMDWESWWEFERLAVELIGDSDTAVAALSRLSLAVERARTWNPASGPLLSRVRDAFNAARDTLPQHVAARAQSLAGAAHVEALCSEVAKAIPGGCPDPVWSPARVKPFGAAPLSERAVRRYLAAHAFANWTPHLGQGLRTWLRSIEAAHALIASGRDVREADLLLRHYGDPKALAGVWARQEKKRVRG